jgi:hypothetical protein
MIYRFSGEWREEESKRAHQDLLVFGQNSLAQDSNNCNNRERRRHTERGTAIGRNALRQSG